MGYADRVPNMAMMSEHQWVPRVVPDPRIDRSPSCCCSPLECQGRMVAVWVRAIIRAPQLPPLSVAAVTARRIDRQQLVEIDLDELLELVGKARSFEVGGQVVEPA